MNRGQKDRRRGTEGKVKRKGRIWQYFFLNEIVPLFQLVPRIVNDSSLVLFNLKNKLGFQTGKAVEGGPDEQKGGRKVVIVVADTTTRSDMQKKLEPKNSV